MVWISCVDDYSVFGEMRHRAYDKLRDYWTEVHQIWIRCSLFIAIERRFTIDQSVVECQNKEYRSFHAMFANIYQI